MNQKIKKKFKYNEIELLIVEREEPYMNSGRTTPAIRVIAPNGGFIPITIQHKETLKSIASRTIEVLNNFKRLGADVENELLKQL